MNAVIPSSDLAPVYRRALNTWRPVILYFTSEHCPACEWAGPVFRQIAEPYRQRANIYMLNTSESPRHPLVTGTPTVLFYKDGRLVKKLMGIGKEIGSAQTVRFTQFHAPTTPASPASPRPL